VPPPISNEPPLKNPFTATTVSRRLLILFVLCQLLLGASYVVPWQGDGYGALPTEAGEAVGHGEPQGEPLLPVSTLAASLTAEAFNVTVTALPRPQGRVTHLPPSRAPPLLTL
jgi:hypothetical protein